MAEKPGHYEYSANGYSGHIQFPYPLTWSHVKEWWTRVIKPMKDKDLRRLDFEYTDCQWEGARDLLLDYGQWALTGAGVAPGDAKNGTVPAEIVTFVIESAEDYLLPFLHPRLRRMLSTTIL